MWGNNGELLRLLGLRRCQYLDGTEERVYREYIDAARLGNMTRLCLMCTPEYCGRIGPETGLES